MFGPKDWMLAIHDKKILVFLLKNKWWILAESLMWFVSPWWRLKIFWRKACFYFLESCHLLDWLTLLIDLESGNHFFSLMHFSFSFQHKRVLESQYKNTLSMTFREVLGRKAFFFFSLIIEKTLVSRLSTYSTHELKNL